MRRALLSSVMLLGLSLTALGAAAGCYLDTLLKNAVERVGPTLTGTPVKVGAVRTSLRRGELTLRRFQVRNPEGFRIQNAFTADLIRVRIRWTSLLTDTVEIEEICVEKPTVVYEGLILRNNLKHIRRNIGSLTGGRDGGGESRGEKPRSYRVERFHVSAGEIVVGSRLLGRESDLKLGLPEVDVRGIGAQEGGASLQQAAAELTGALTRSAGEAVRSSEVKEDILRAAERWREMIMRRREKERP
ncbi:MAG: hypothetical protein ABIJ96_05860 [Elusimicrobiota bacterium]